MIEDTTKQVVVEKVGIHEETYGDFANSLPADECQDAVFDCDFTTDENCHKSMIFFISWSPDTSKVKAKMLYATSKDRFKRELDGIQVELQATDPSEMSLEDFKYRALYFSNDFSYSISLAKLLSSFFRLVKDHRKLRSRTFSLHLITLRRLVADL